MAILLKPEADKYKDKFGNKLRNPYAVVDYCFGDKKARIQVIKLDIYKSKKARKQKLNPLERRTYTIEGDEWDTWFSPEAISADDDQYEKSYEYLHSLPEWENWISDEKPEP